MTRNNITILATLLLSALLMANCSKDEVSFTGNLFGTVTDRTTGEPLKDANVTLTPLGKSVKTGSDGHYGFMDIDAQEYTVTVSKENYSTDSKSVQVKVGGDSRLDFALRSSQPKLEVSQQTLDFGNEYTTLTLNIKNTGFATLHWELSEDITWLSCVPTSGEIASGASKGVVVNVDRNGMKVDDYSQTIAITSNGGNAVIRVNMSVQGMAVNVSPQELDFGATTSSLQLTMSGGDNVSYTLTPSNDWILPNKTSGVFSKSENIIVAVDRNNHAEGNYEGNLLLKVGEHSKDIPVRMTILPKSKPATTLLSVDDITDASATFKGAVISVGSARVTRYGFCWGKQENPGLQDAESCNFGDCSAAVDMEYTANLLDENTRYYVRAYAENSEGVSYSNQLMFTTDEKAQKPEVETGEADRITSSQAEITGKILKVGDKEGITQHGHVWGTKANPTVDNQKTQLGKTNVTGGFVSTLTGLEPNSTYHVRAYAINSIGTSYGEDITFTTLPDIVTMTTIAARDIIHNAATVGGSISDDGGNIIVERGVCWSTGPNPTIDSERKASQEASARFNVRLEGLNELTAYHARAYVMTEDGKAYYGNDVTFSTTHEIHLPEADVTTVDNIGTTVATFHSSVTSDGDGNISDCGFCYSRTPNPTVNDVKVSCGKRMGKFLATVKELHENTTYYVRAYVTNEAGTAYGEEVNFATLEILPPTLTAVTVKTVTHRSATLAAEVLSEGNGNISESGFVFSINPNPGLTNHKVSCGTSLSLSGRAESLLPNTTYYIRAFATNEKGTAFGEESSFTTKEEPEGSSIEVDGGYDSENDWDKKE